MGKTASKVLMPTETYIGDGAAGQLAGIVKRLGAKRIFVFTDKGVMSTGLVAPLVETLGEVCNSVTVFDETEPEPTVTSIEKASLALKNAGGTELLISIGGGSVMDSAKCANIVSMNGGSILDYEDGMQIRKEVRTLLPHVAIPTTAGTGSEATVWAIFTDPKRRFKTAVQDPRLIADAVILDPQMTRTMPPKVTAATGMDALTHAIEAYVCVTANPITEAFCLHAMRLVAENLRTVVEDGDNIEARTNMLLASFMGGSAFSNSSLGIVHTMAETIGGFYRIPHGVTNALMLPHVMEFNRSANPAKFARMAQALGENTIGLNSEEASRRSVVAVREMSKATGLPQKLREVGVKKQDFPDLVRMAFRWANHSGNPREVSEDQLRSLYEEAF